MNKQVPFVVAVVVEDEVYSTHYSFHGLRKTLRLAAQLAAGIPSAFVSIRYKGERIAALETDWRGKVSEAEVFRYWQAPDLPYRQIRVTPLNPAVFNGA